jgi:U6 snRNA-associated Sm-like protein LSm1
MERFQLTGTASLAEELDKSLMVVLRDGRKIVGTLRSFDQFANIVLEHAFERVIVGKQYSDVPLGLYVIRGENVVLLGQVDEKKDAHTTSELLQRVEIDEILEAKKAQEDERKLKASLCRHLNKSAETWDFDI